LDQAIGALETCVRFNPLRLAAHRFLISLYRKTDGHEEQIRHHQKQIRDCFEFFSSRREQIKQLRQEIQARARQREAEPIKFMPFTLSHVENRASEKKIPREFLVVSGLPRSGTSLMMQMLARGGFPIMSDQQRAADADNPEGYFEWDEIKQLPSNPRLIEKCAGRAVKIVSPLLAHLPRELSYKVIFMGRPVAEIAASQRVMRERLSGKKIAEAENAEMEQLLERHLQQTLAGLRAAKQISLLVLDYHDLIFEPEQSAQRVVDFIGRERLPAWKEMAAAIKPALYRNRRQPENVPA
jgi:hypothetical protein